MEAVARVRTMSREGPLGKISQGRGVLSRSLLWTSRVTAQRCGVFGRVHCSGTGGDCWQGGHRRKCRAGGRSGLYFSRAESSNVTALRRIV